MSKRWMPLLFLLGAACFAIASIASQWGSAPRPWVGGTFFVGSLLFTSGGALQLRETPNVAAVGQFAGTLLFNVSTFAALQHGLTAAQSDLRVWTPDVLGSLCFLVSSELSFREVCHRWVSRPPRTRAGRVAALNLAGSVLFGASAVTALIEPSTDEPVSAAIANATTTAGALCFLVGALLLLPEQARRRSATAARPLVD